MEKVAKLKDFIGDKWLEYIKYVDAATDDSIESLCDGLDPEDMICSIFRWSETKEGALYWSQKLDKIYGKSWEQEWS